MKIETEEIVVTKMVAKYIADDGKVFYNNRECEAYENELLSASFNMLDEELNETDNIIECQYVKLDTSDAVDKFISCNEYYELTTDGISAPGVYFFDERTCRWINLDEVALKFKEATK